MIFGNECDVYFQTRCQASFEIFLPYGPMLTKRKKKIIRNQKFKILKIIKKNLEIWWVGICPQNVALILSLVSEKMMSADDGHTDGIRENDVYGRRTYGRWTPA